MRNMLPKWLGFSSSVKQPSSMIQELCRRFSLVELRKATNDFHKSRIIGSGIYGTVYKGCILVNGETKEVAIKRASLGIIGSENFDNLKKEIVLLCQLRHQNLVSFIGFYEGKNEMILVFEYLSNGVLGDRIHGADMPCLSWKKRLEICIGIARGLHYLHTGVKRTIIHCDVKPTIILLDENWVPKICGFGFWLKAPYFSSKDPKPKIVSVIRCTLGYVAPEYATRGIVTEKIDVYSFGMVLLELVCAKRSIEILEEIKTDIDLNDSDSQDEGKIEEKSTDVDLTDSNSQDEGKSESPISFKDFTITVHEEIVNKIIDPFLKDKIAPKCLELFMGIANKCLRGEATERPSMNEVEMELELALQLQEEADTNLPSDSGNDIISNTGISSQPLEARS